MTTLTNSVSRDKPLQPGFVITLISTMIRQLEIGTRESLQRPLVFEMVS